MEPRPKDGEAPEREVDVLRRAVGFIERLLPAAWSCEVSQQMLATAAAVDATVRVVSPEGVAVTFVAKSKLSLVTADLPPLIHQLREVATGRADDRERDAGDRGPLVVARYLSPSVQTWLEQRDIAYADATGNIRLSSTRPGLFLRNCGAARDPWRGPGRPRGTLKGEPAARVVRALVDFRPPVSVPELVMRAGASTGATYRVVAFLERETLVERTPRGPISKVRWRQLLERWAQDYGFQQSNVIRRFLQPRGIAVLLTELAAATGLRYVVTGSVAAQNWAPYAPVRTAMIYVDDPDRFAQQMGLREVEVGANVLLATGKLDVVYDRPQVAEGVLLAAPSQTAVDLLTGPGRNPAEAQALLDWMEANPDAWRR